MSILNIFGQMMGVSIKELKMASYLCDSCHGSCCRTYRLTITISDFLDLALLKGIQEAVNGTSFEAIPYNSNLLSNKRMMMPFIFDDLNASSPAMYLLCLKRVPSELFGEGVVRCHFLQESKREEVKINPNLPDHENHPGSKFEGLCGVYSHRPTMCRTYPMAFNPDLHQSFLKRRDNPQQVEHNSAFKLCPKEKLELSDFGLDDPQQMMNKQNDLLLGEARTQAHNHAVMQWNSLPKRSTKEVIGYFVNVGKNMIQVPREQIQSLEPPVVINSLEALERAKLKQSPTVGSSS